MGALICEACRWPVWRSRAPTWVPDVAISIAVNLYNNALLYGFIGCSAVGAAYLVLSRVRGKT